MKKKVKMKKNQKWAFVLSSNICKLIWDMHAGCFIPCYMLNMLKLELWIAFELELKRIMAFFPRGFLLFLSALSPELLKDDRVP